MLDKKVRQQFKMLREIKPDAEWIKNERHFLLWKVCPQESQVSALNFLVSLLVSRSFLAPSISAVVVVVLVISGSLAAYSGASQALPGDNLYQVKVTLEQARIALSFSTDAKAKLEVERVGRRAQELGKVIERVAKEDANNERIDQALLTLKDGVTKMKTLMGEVRKADNSGQVVAMAKYVDGKIKDYRETINKTSQDLSENLDEQATNEIQATLNLFDETGLEVVAVAVEQVTSQKEIIETEIQEVNQLINEKIDETQRQVANLSEGNVRVNMALESIESAKQFLNKNDLKLALAKVKEARLIVQEAQTPPATASLDESTQPEGEVKGDSAAGADGANETGDNWADIQSTSTEQTIVDDKREVPAEFKIIIGR